jgi:putative spermidine/putrescine transport system ATP-binding protein
MSFLTLTGVSKDYAGTRVVHDFTLAVERGEFVSLLGPSGCGKTTTLQMIAGFIPASTGVITLDGADITHVAPNHRGLGIVFQSYALFPHMTVAENVGFGLEMRKIPKAERTVLIREALAKVHLDPHSDRYPRQLSGGQRQRVALARALVIKPPVLLLDEPLSNLDAKLREEMQFELRRIQREVGITTLMVTHDQAEALSISDRVVVMQAGRITQVDQPHRMYEHPHTGFISKFVGKTNLLTGEVVKPTDADGIATVLVGDVGVEILESGLVPGQTVTLCIRPEKFILKQAGLGRLLGTVQRRYFLGNQWLYEVGSPLGLLEVAVPNLGDAPLEEQSPVGIDWQTGIVRVLGESLTP